MAGWTTLPNLYREELKQRREEGCDLTAFLATHPGVPEDRTTLNRWYDELMALPVAAGFPYTEPSDWDGIAAARPAPMAIAKREIPFDKFYGAWLGRCIGCALGKPTEGFMGGKDGLPSWKLDFEWFRQADAYPIAGYTPKDSGARETLGIDVGCPLSQRENIAFMESDDDIRYTVLGQKLLDRVGDGFTTWDMADEWFSELPCYMLCTAERQAYINLADGIELRGTDGDAAALDHIRTYRNPYREWIGAQIRVDGMAYGAAGDPERASSYAWRDASLSHVKNGIYGEMFFGAAIAAAFVEDDMDRILDIALSKIPADCRLAHDIADARRIAAEATDRIDLIERVYARFGHYHPVHTNNNAAMCVAALLWGKGDFTETVSVAVLGGWDTDCNGATVGSLMGAFLGADAIPACWKEPLHDTLNSNIFGYHPIAISKCARRSQAYNRNLRG